MTIAVRFDSSIVRSLKGSLLAYLSRIRKKDGNVKQRNREMSSSSEGPLKKKEKKWEHVSRERPSSLRPEVD